MINKIVEFFMGNEDDSWGKANEAAWRDSNDRQKLLTKQAAENALLAIEEQRKNNVFVMTATTPDISSVAQLKIS